MTEAVWRNTVVELATMLGWRVYYVENSTRVIRTATRGTIRVRNVNIQGVGFPDLVLIRARDARILFAELKRGKRDRRGGAGGGTYEITEQQEVWLNDLRSIAARIADGASTGRIGVHVWRPEHIEEIKKALR